MTGSVLAVRQLRAEVRDRIVRHIDGLAIGSTVAALEERGVLRFLLAHGRMPADEVSGRFGGNPGYCQVALRLLADQGWLRLSGTAGADRLEAEVTASGAVAFALAPVYRQAAGFLTLAQRARTLLAGAADQATSRELERACELMRGEWLIPRELRPLRVRHQVLAHLDGHMIAPLMAELARQGAFTGDSIQLPASLSDQSARLAVLDLLARQGWLAHDAGQGALTEAGRFAARGAAQYWYPVGYLPMLADVPRLLFGSLTDSRDQPSGGQETHVDREMDVRFSGEVFNGRCRDYFLELALPVFDADTAEQPECVIDTGCGDGTVLAELYHAIRDRTGRGCCLSQEPLLMIGADPSPVARRLTAERLGAERIPHLVVDGDIGDPIGLSRMLAAQGVNACRALHISKSALHNRRIRLNAGACGDPGRARPRDPGQPRFSGAYAAPDGASLTSAEVTSDLAELFRAWHPLIRRHGMIVVEAHAADPAVTARLLGSSLHTALDATHGYSCQYPVEPDAFAWAARAGGLATVAHREIGTETYGHVFQTVDHFIPG